MKVKVKVAQLCLTLCDPMDYTVHGIHQARILEWVTFPFSRGIFLTQGLDLGIEPVSPALQVDSLPAEPQGKPKGTFNRGTIHRTPDWVCQFVLIRTLLSLVSVSLFSSVQFSSVTHSCPTLCDPMNCSTPGLPVHHQLPEFTQTYVHRVGDAIRPSHPLSSPSPPDPNPSQHQSLFQ